MFVFVGVAVPRRASCQPTPNVRISERTLSIEDVRLRRGVGHHDGLWDQIVDGKTSVANWNSAQLSANTNWNSAQLSAILGGVTAWRVFERRPNGKHGIRNWATLVEGSQTTNEIANQTNL